jgi:hypothetical protein
MDALQSVKEVDERRAKRPTDAAMQMGLRNDWPCKKKMCQQFIKEKEEMIVMKQAAIMIAIFAFLWGAGTCFADSAIPNMVGTWTVNAEGAVLAKGGAAGAKTHHSGEFSTLTAEAVVTKQQGRVLHGTFKSPKATESFIAVIGPDNKSLYYADEDGTIEGKIINKDRMEVIYRHVTASDTVIGVGTWTRKK